MHGAIIAFVVATGFMSGAASACSCLIERSAEGHLRALKPEVVFKGVAVSERRFRGDEATTRFRVLEVLRGDAGRNVALRHGLDESSCGIRYRRGQTLLVMAHRGRDGMLHTSLCSQPFYCEADYRRALQFAHPELGNRPARQP